MAHTQSKFLATPMTKPLMTQSSFPGSEALNFHGCEFNSSKEHAGPPTWVELATSGTQADLTYVKESDALAIWQLTLYSYSSVLAT